MFGFMKNRIGQLLKRLGIIDSNTIKNALEIQKKENKLFGSILVEKNIIKKDFLEEIIDASTGNEKSLYNIVNKKIGEIFVSLNYVTKEQVNEALNEQKDKKIGSVLLEKGLIQISQLKKVLKVQKRFASILAVSLISFSSIQACTPRVSFESSIGIVQDYSSSNINKVLNDRVGSTLNYHQDGTIAISNIPYFKQGNNNTCAQSVMASVLNFWGVPVSYQSIIKQTNSSNIFTDVNSITSYLRKNGLYAQDYRQADINFLKDRINKGNPVIILLDFGKITTEHYVLVTGYNDKEREFIILDPIDGPNQKYDYDRIEQMWKNNSLKNVKLFGDKYSKIAFDIYNPSANTTNYAITPNNNNIANSSNLRGSY